MQEFTRIIGYIYRTGISLANCLEYSTAVENSEGVSKERDKGE